MMENNEQGDEGRRRVTKDGYGRKRQRRDNKETYVRRRKNRGEEERRWENT